MFDKEMLDTLWTDLRGKYNNDPDWDRIVRDTHLGVARSDAGVDLGDIDSRAAEAIVKHREPA
jgi:hypothetical protein